MAHNEIQRTHYDAALAVAVKDAERKVIEWAEVYVGSLHHCDDHGWDELVAAVRELWRVRGDHA